MDDEDGGLFAIAISEDEFEKPQKPNRRTEQNEEEFQIVKDSYRTKIENGNIHQNITLPLGEDADKLQTQEVVHAVEELYFFRRFAEAADIIQRALGPGPSGDKGPFDDETKKLLNSYRERCWRRI